MSYPINDKEKVISYTQRYLAEVGLYRGRIDGKWGPLTARGLKAVFHFSNFPSAVSANDSERWLAYFVQRMALESGRLLRLDGHWGPTTEHEFEILSGGGVMTSDWKDQAEDRAAFAADPWQWPSQEAIRGGHSVFGSPGSGLIVVNLPWPLRLAWDLDTVVNRVTCHDLVRPAFLQVMEEVAEHYDASSRRQLGLDLFGGCYAKRKVRGGSRMSMHAWGIAFDFHPSGNRLDWDHTKAVFAKPEYGPWFRAWEKAGAVSLGKAMDCDWMHTQFARLS